MPSSAAADGVPEQLDTSVRVVDPNAPGGASTYQSAGFREPHIPGGGCCGGGPLKVDAPGSLIPICDVADHRPTISPGA
jgi:hypothetical protein